MSQPGGRIAAETPAGSRPVSDLVAAAAAGDGRAWEAIVRRFSGLVWSVARAHDLGLATASDVNQAVWRRLAAQLDDIAEPDRLGAWLASVARNESLRVLAEAAGETVATKEVNLDHDEASSPASDVAPIWLAVEGLPRHCRAVLRVAMADPHPSLEEIAAALGQPIESVGRTRQQSLERLRSIVAVS